MNIFQKRSRTIILTFELADARPADKPHSGILSSALIWIQDTKVVLFNTKTEYLDSKSSGKFSAFTVMIVVIHT